MSFKLYIYKSETHWNEKCVGSVWRSYQIARVLSGNSSVQHWLYYLDGPFSFPYSYGLTYTGKEDFKLVHVDLVFCAYLIIARDCVVECPIVFLCGHLMIVCHLINGSIYEVRQNVWPEEKFREQQKQQSFIWARFGLNHTKVCCWGHVYTKKSRRRKLEI